MSTFQLERLDNGLRILTAPMESAQSVTCAIMLAAGSRYETESTNGIAHFSEHMFFKGTKRRPTARDISMEIDAIGGEFNAFTGLIHAADERVPADAIEFGAEAVFRALQRLG